jgi:large subunit ribosomal protein L10
MVLSDYRGFTVKEITELRRKLRAEDSELHIIKNTLIERAATESGYEGLKDSLKGSTAVLLGYRDALSPLKVLVKFIKETEKGGIRAGVVEKTLLSQKDLGELAKLPPKEVLIGKLVGGLKSPLFGLVNVLQGPIRKLVYALNAIKDLPDRTSTSSVESQASKKGGE